MVVSISSIRRNVFLWSTFRAGSGTSLLGAIQWAIRERSDWGIKGVSRNHGTVQKDWVTIKSHELAEGFCLAVIGHAGWAKDIEAAVPYSLVISFEAVNQSHYL